MALCFAHAAAGYLGYELYRPSSAHRPALLASAVFLANAADLDFVPGLLVGDPGVYHRGLSHTLFAAVVVGLVVALAARQWRPPGRAWGLGLWAGAVYGSHLLVDWLTTDVVPPHGGRFLWPLSDAYYLAPVTPIPELVVDMSSPGAFFRSLLDLHALGPWLLEAACLAGIVVATHLVRATALRAPERPVDQPVDREAADRT